MAAVGTVGVTGNLYINGVLQGTKWGVNALTFSFPASAAYYGTPYGSGENATGFEAFNAAQQSAVRSILKQYSAVANFTFTEIAETSTQHAEIRYAESDLPATAWSYYPSTSALGGDAWFNNSKNLYDAPVLGNYAWLILMHETGHAMGLKHPHAASGSFGAMPVDRDSLEYTVMSYRSYIGASPTGLTSEAYGYPQSLMMYDIAGLQTMYGANYATNAGNTVYSWNPLTGQQSINGVAQTAPGGNRIFLTIWDGGGQDTYDFSNYTTNLKVDLNPGAWTTVSSGQLANLGGGKQAAGNIANALLYNGNVASLIENAIGGNGNDTLIGNVADNKLTGGRGNDVLDGGAGTDTAIYSGLSTNYQVVKNTNGSWTITDLRSGSPDGTDTLTNIEKIQYSNALTLIGATGSVNQPPVVTAPDITVTAKQTIAASSMFTVKDAENNAITKYQFWDDSPEATSGYFVVGGVAKPADVMIEITAAQLSQTYFVAGSTSDILSIRAFDGTSWGVWDNLVVTPKAVVIPTTPAKPPTNTVPVVTAPDITVTAKQTIAASSMFTVKDAENNAITKYQFWDDSPEATSGYFVVGGVAKPADVMIEVTAAQLSQTYFVAGSTSDILSIRAFDGTSWGVWDNLVVTPKAVVIPTTPTNTAPVVTAPDITVTAKQTIAASSMFTVKDTENNAITKYQFWDDSPEATSGYFVVGGVAKPADVMIEITAAQLSLVSFVAGSTSDILSIRAFDGTSWGEWDNLVVTPKAVVTPTTPTTSINTAPVVTAKNMVATAKQVIAASSMFTVKDAENNAITKYQFWDDSVEATSGHFTVGGVVKAADVMIEITAAQLSQTSFVAGSTSDVISVRAFDGKSWGEWDNFLVKPPTSLTPVVTSDNIVAHPQQTIAASSMFAVAKTAGAITKYQFWDDSPEATSGHFIVGGVIKAADTMIEVTAAQLSQTYFVAGSTADILSVRAFDGTSWGAWDNLLVKPKADIVAAAITQNIVADPHKTISASSLIADTKAAGSYARYQFWDDSPEATSGHFTVGGVARAADTMIEVTAAQLAQTYFVTGSTADILSVRVFDGTSWGEWDNFLVKPPTNLAPLVTSENILATSQQVIAASSMFEVTKTTGAITKYQFWDDSVEATSGHFVVGGVVKAADTMIEVTAAQLSQTHFVAGSTADVLSVRAFDGTSWGAWDNFFVKPAANAASATANAAPVVTTEDIAAPTKAVIAASSMFTAKDTDGVVTKYQLWDDTADASSGHFTLDGRKVADTTLEVTAAKLAQVNFVVGSTPDDVKVRAFDGQAWSEWKPISVTPATLASDSNHVTGTNGNNILFSTPANDVMRGGAGSDTFVFGPNFAKDVIADIQIGGVGHDYVEFVHAGLANFADLIAHAEQVGNNVSIAVDAANTLALQNTTVSSIAQHHDHFLFVA